MSKNRVYRKMPLMYIEPVESEACLRQPSKVEIIGSKVYLELGGKIWASGIHLRINNSEFI